MTRPENRLLPLCSLAIAVVALQLAGPARAADGEAAFIDAMQVYEAGNFPAAELRLQAAAGEGHWRAHEVLAFMYTIGPPLYQGIQPDRSKAARHFESAAAGGSASSGYMLCALARRADNALRPGSACSRSAARLQRRVSWHVVPYESD